MESERSIEIPRPGLAGGRKDWAGLGYGVERVAQAAEKAIVGPRDAKCTRRGTELHMVYCISDYSHKSLCRDEFRLGVCTDSQRTLERWYVPAEQAKEQEQEDENEVGQGLECSSRVCRGQENHTASRSASFLIIS
jgi:hypothetical protein